MTRPAARPRARAVRAPSTRDGGRPAPDIERRTRLAENHRNRGWFSACPSPSPRSPPYTSAQTRTGWPWVSGPNYRGAAKTPCTGCGPGYSWDCRGRRTPPASWVSCAASEYLYARSNSRTSASFPFSSTISAVWVAFSASPASSGWLFTVKRPRATCT